MRGEDKEERLIIRTMQQMLFGKSAGTPRPEQVPYAREHAKRYCIWDSGRIGKIERAISRETEAGRVYTTGQLTRAVKYLTHQVPARSKDPSIDLEKLFFFGKPLIKSQSLFPVYHP